MIEHPIIHIPRMTIKWVVEKYLLHSHYSHSLMLPQNCQDLGLMYLPIQRWKSFQGLSSQSKGTCIQKCGRCHWSASKVEAQIWSLGSKNAKEMRILLQIFKELSFTNDQIWYVCFQGEIIKVWILTCSWKYLIIRRRSNRIFLFY